MSSAPRPTGSPDADAKRTAQSMGEVRELRQTLRRLPTSALDSEQRLIVGGSLALAVLLHVSAVLVIAALPEKVALATVPSGLHQPLRSVEVVRVEQKEEPEEPPSVEPQPIEIAEPPPRVEPEIELARLDVTPPPAPARPRLQRRVRRARKPEPKPEAPKPAAAAAPRPAVKQITSNAPGAEEAAQPESDGPIGEAAPSSAEAPAEPGGSSEGATAGAATGSPDGVEEGPDLAALEQGYISRVTRAVGRKYVYPRRAKRAGLEGRVLVELTIDSSGHVVGSRVVKSSGHPILDQAALEAIASIGDLPAPPRELGWTRKAMTVPFVYRLGRG